MRFALRILLFPFLIAMAFTGLLATGAHADLVWFASGDDIPPSDGAETTFIEDTLLLGDVLFKLENDTVGPPVTLTAIDSETGTVNWDFTGLGISLSYLVVVDGGVGGDDTNTKLYNIFQVINGQNISSGGDEDIWCCGENPGDEPFREISHVVFVGSTPTTSVPEPATMLLLGSGLLGVALIARRRAR